MNITNRLNLPLPIVRAVTNDPYSQRGDISITGLIQPPRIRQLAIRHGNNITIDASDRIWPLLGSNVHYILERAQVGNALQEEPLAMGMFGWTVTGKPDLYYDEILYDFKVTSVWSFINGVKTEWESQLNCYAGLLRYYAFEVKALAIIAILRDWSKYQVCKSANYPKTQAVVMSVKLWDAEKTWEYMKERIKIHQEAEHMVDTDLPICTAEERWERPTQYAVTIKGQKRAKRLLSTMEEAQEWGEENIKDKKWEIITRTGESVRCCHYCDVSKICGLFQNKEDM